MGSTYDICISRRRYNNYANYSIGWAAGGVAMVLVWFCLLVTGVFMAFKASQSEPENSGTDHC